MLIRNLERHVNTEKYSEKSQGDICLTGRLVTEIITLRSLQDIALLIEADLYSYLSQKEEISERLGNFLRDAEDKYGEEDWFKQFSLDKLGGGGSKDGKKRKKKKKSKKTPDNWVPFKGMLLSSSIQGEAEIMFETIGELSRKHDALENVKAAVEELKNIGIGNEVNYICFIKDGILEKIVIKPIDSDTVEKFSFAKGFSSMISINK